MPRGKRADVASERARCRTRTQDTCHFSQHDELHESASSLLAEPLLEDPALYLAEALEQLGSIPELRCADGREAAFTENGQPIDDATYRQRLATQTPVNCDAPALGNGLPMACVPHTRIVMQETVHREQRVVWAAICTKDVTTWDLSDRYALLNVIGYNTVTGRTGFFTRSRDPGATSVPGLFPSLARDASSRAGFLSAVQMATSKALNDCVSCHNGAPFRRTKFAQAFDEWKEGRQRFYVPRSTFAFAEAYDPIGRPLPTPSSASVGLYWPAVRLKAHRLPECVRCHVLGGGDSRFKEAIEHAWVGGAYAGSKWHHAIAWQRPADPSQPGSTRSLTDALVIYLRCLDNLRDVSCWEYLPTRRAPSTPADCN